MILLPFLVNQRRKSNKFPSYSEKIAQLIHKITKTVYGSMFAQYELSYMSDYNFNTCNYMYPLQPEISKSG